MRTSKRLSITAALAVLGSVTFAAASISPASAQLTRGQSTGTSIFGRENSVTGPSNFATSATVERLLVANGLAPGTSDGIVDNDTRQAIRTFQSQNGLQVDGRISLQLVIALSSHALDLIPGAQMQLDITPNANSLVVENIVRANRARAQRILARNGFAPGRTDGASINQTEQAIRNFQSQVGMPITGQVSTELVAALDEFDGFSSRQVRRPLPQLTGVLNRPGFSSDFTDIGDATSGGEGWALRTIANAQLIPVDGIAGAARIEGILVAAKPVDNLPIFSSAVVDTDDNGRPRLNFNRVALNWSGFLVIDQDDDTGPYEFALQVNMAEMTNGGSCNFVLMLNEDDRLYTIINLRIEQSTRSPERASVFLEKGIHQVELWTQCDKPETIDDFALNLLMRGGDTNVLQPIRGDNIVASDVFLTSGQ